MPRLHLFEFEDQQWFPKFIRNYMTDFLQFVANAFGFFKSINPILKKGLEAGKTNTVIDIASGGGGAWLKVGASLQAEVPNLKVMLTDYYPNIDAFERMKKLSDGWLSYHPDRVDALAVPSELKGLRTQFLSFHHFSPSNAKAILQDAVNQKMPIAIFEAQERNLAHFIQFIFSPISVLLTTPFIRPFKLGRIIFTYLIPIVPILVLWDGLVSVLRTYSVKEMNEMVNELEGKDNFEWEINKLKEGPVTILYLLGSPK